ncbi:MAG TPA: antitoxin MazE-like protein [Candidatus Binataceae bacterium]
MTRQSWRRRPGLPPIETPISEVLSPTFATQTHRQPLAIARSPYEKKDLGFIDAIPDWNGE